MKLQMTQIDLVDPSKSKIISVIEVNSFEEAIRKTHFTEEYDVQQYEIDIIASAFTENDNMFIDDDEELRTIYFKL